MQVLSMTPDQISVLDQTQQASIMQLVRWFLISRYWLMVAGAVLGIVSCRLNYAVQDLLRIDGMDIYNSGNEQGRGELFGEEGDQRTKHRV